MDLPIYHISRIIEESGEKVQDGSHIIYVNGSYRNTEEEIGRLMHDFSCEAAEEMLNPMLADHVSYYKETKGGLKKMSKLVEDFAKEWGQEMAQEMAEGMAQKMAQETTKKTVVRMLEDGKLSLEDIVRYSNLSMESVKELQNALITK